MNRTDVKDGNDFREAIIGIANYMAFAQKETVSFNEPIDVDWGLKGTIRHEGVRKVIPVVALIDKTEY